MQNNNSKEISVCYFGSYNPNFSRNKVYCDGLIRNGIKIIEIRSEGRGIKKYISLAKQHWGIRNLYDVMIVGFPGQKMAVWARFLTLKPIILDALCSAYEAEIISRRPEMSGSFWAWKIWFFDWLSFRLSDKVLVETNAQKEYLSREYRIDPSKFVRIFTGVDEEKFNSPSVVEKDLIFSVLFRGRLLPEAGVEYIISAAKILENEKIDFTIIGFGDKEREVEEQLKKLGLKNLIYIKQNLNDIELTRIMKQSHISLGQLSSHERLKRTIPHKAFESLFLRLPYVTADVPGIKELLIDGINCLLVNPADPKDLAEKILYLKNNPEMCAKLAENGFKTYEDKFSSDVLGSQLTKLLISLKS